MPDNPKTPCSPTPLSRRRLLSGASWSALGLGLGALFSRFSHGAEQESVLTQSPVNTASGTTGFVYDARFLKQNFGMGHPESPKRLKMVLKQLQQSGLYADLTPVVPSVDPLSYIQQVHPESHIQQVAKQTRHEAAIRLAVSGVLDAVDAVCTGRVTNAFCATRPPGHHASFDGEYGFCFYNNVAIAARYAQQKYNLRKILIVDWDYHHGNGTEWAFYGDPSVLFFSTHAFYAFPGTGSPDKIGAGDGRGFNINVPLPSGANDKAILDAFTKQLVPAATAFQPDLILISAGFDARKDDVLGDFAVTDAGFAELTQLVMGIAAEHCNSRVISIMEGGYNTYGLSLAVESHVATLLSA